MRFLRAGLWVLSGTVLAVLAVAASLWLWSGASTSLGTVVAFASGALSGGQSLETRDVQGTLQEGGSIAWLKWRQGPLSVEVQDLQVRWSWAHLLQGEARIPTLSARRVQIDDQRPSTPAGTSPAPTEWMLPVPVDVHWAIQTLELRGSTRFDASDLAGHYTFNSVQHKLDEGRARIASGSYRLQGTLQARAPMAVVAEVNGTVPTQVPGRAAPLDLPAQAKLSGTLSGGDATLDVQASLQPADPRAMQVAVTARVRPWQPQPVAQAQAQWRALDLAAVWPQAPATLLSGEASVKPQGLGWQATVQLANALPAPWNQNRVPLERLEAELAYTSGLWTVSSLQANGAGGQLRAQGKVNASQATLGWVGEASVWGVNTAALDSRLDRVVVDGHLSASHRNGGIAFDADVSERGEASPRSALAGLRLRHVKAAGLWSGATWKLDELKLETDDATLQGQVTLNTTTLGSVGQLSLAVPGAQATAQGELGPTQGGGAVQVKVLDATRLSAWLLRLPGAPADGSNLWVKGEAGFDATWQGGWQDQGRNLRLDGVGRVPRGDWGSKWQPESTWWHLQDAQLSLSGPLQALALTTQAQLSQGSTRVHLQASAQSTRIDAATWELQLNTAQAVGQVSALGGAPGTERQGPWTAKLGAPVTWRYTQRAGGPLVASSPGAVLLSGPLPGTASVAWQTARWSQEATATGPRTQWSSQGRLTNVPFAWAELFSTTSLQDLGMRGDIVLGGQWDASSNDTLHLQAHLERTAGDLQWLADEDETSTLSAGLRVARVEVTGDGDRLQVQLRWDSERAGQLQADVTTRLQRAGDGWVWAPDAAVNGQVKAQLPRVAAWSVLAPPGWRLRGTLDADATLTGTRQRPQWRGHLGAKNLAIRSVVDGVDFSGGTLATRLEGERLEITAFNLQGAGGASGGDLTAQGFVLWGDGLRLEMDAVARALRVSARSDRRLVLSGNLSARLDASQLAIRGKLKADQALFVMPEDSAPRLGNDVVVRQPARSGPAPAPRSAAPAPATSHMVQPEVDVTLDLGQDFQVRGSGLKTLLEGSVELRNTGRTLAPRLSGTLRTVQGTYKAYGQQLDIEEGVLRFTGPYNNPSLDILAIRPNMTQRVGVQISGTAQLPVVRLYADPDLSEAEKLSWLVLGRSGANGGAETALLQQAALALLGGKVGGGLMSGGLADAFGLDEISLKGASSGDSAVSSAAGASSGSTGSLGATGATVTLGKRLSRDFYVAYERSLAGTVGTLSIFYDLSRRFTLRAQTGEQSAVDLIFTLRYD